MSDMVKLIKSLGFKSNWLLFLEIKIHNGSFLHCLLTALGIAIGASFESDQNFKLSFYYLKIYSITFLIGEF